MIQEINNLIKNAEKKSRAGANVNAYLILKQNNNVLLSLRQNTGYADGFYGLVSGHVEDGESATTAIIREAYEEAGIELTPNQLKVTHIIHRKTNRLNVDIFFECEAWRGRLNNQEPEKCGGLDFYPMNALPINTMDYIADSLRAVVNKEFYSEHGW